MTVDEVREQVEYVALVTKQASSISDLRHHTYLSSGIKAPVVYFRAADQGACTYMNDARDAGANAICTRPIAVLLAHQCARGVCMAMAPSSVLPPHLRPLRCAVLPHGACWYDLCEDLEVIDVPGDHFSLLRQVRGLGGHVAGDLPHVRGAKHPGAHAVPLFPSVLPGRCRHERHHQCAEAKAGAVRLGGDSAPRRQGLLDVSGKSCVG